jgi:hypothetical protein
MGVVLKIIVCGGNENRTFTNSKFKIQNSKFRNPYLIKVSEF